MYRHRDGPAKAPKIWIFIFSVRILANQSILIDPSTIIQAFHRDPQLFLLQLQLLSNGKILCFNFQPLRESRLLLFFCDIADFSNSFRLNKYVHVNASHEHIYFRSASFSKSEFLLRTEIELISADDVWTLSSDNKRPTKRRSLGFGAESFS